MNFWDEDFYGGGATPEPSVDATPDIPTPPSAPSSSGAYSYPGSFDEIGYAWSAAFGDTIPDWMQGNEMVTRVMASQAKTVEQTGAAKDGGKSLLDRVSGFVGNNKSLTEMALRGVAGAVTARQQRKAQLAQLKEQDRQRQAQAARVSSSVSGLRAPGIINRQVALRRIDGSPVYQRGIIGS